MGKPSAPNTERSQRRRQRIYRNVAAHEQWKAKDREMKKTAAAVNAIMRVNNDEMKEKYRMMEL